MSELKPQLDGTFKSQAGDYPSLFVVSLTEVTLVDGRIVAAKDDSGVQYGVYEQRINGKVYTNLVRLSN